MKRAGFTMIELIFVIVILGILAAVAIPKLAATRDDATVSKVASNITASIKSMGGRYIAAGEFDDIMNDYISADHNQTATCSDGCVISFWDNNDDQEVCIIATLITEGNITVADGAGTGVVCDGVRRIVDAEILQFGGSNVTY